MIEKLTEDPKPVNDRMITLRLPLNENRHCFIIAIYALTMTNSPETITQFYHQLDSILKNVSKEDKILLLGDFNARVGQDVTIWNRVLGRFGTGQVNFNGELLLSICTEHQLVITNTCFKHKPVHKNSWMHPRSKHWHLIDYVITRQRDLCDIHDTRAMRGANCSTDHIMIRTKTSLRARQCMRKANQRPRKLNVSKIKCDTIRNDLKNSIKEKLPTLVGSVEEKWHTFKSTVHDMSKQTLGYMVKKHADWFDENDTELRELINA